VCDENIKPEQPPIPITEELLQELVRKYTTIFETRFPRLQLRVFRSFSGKPPIDDVPEEWLPALPNTPVVSGLFFNVGRDYRIGINKGYDPAGQLMSFFHEYGHARFRRETNEPIDNTDKLIRTEAAAIRCSLELADAEGLPEVAYLAVDTARTAAPMGTVYQKAMEEVQNDQLWVKYSNRSSG
jgi:hypothetical protein